MRRAKAGGWFWLKVTKNLSDISPEILEAWRTAKGYGPAQAGVTIEAKSAGDFTNTNKRRKEEAIKLQQLKNTHGSGVRFVLFLCGYFGSDYLGYEAAEGIDWVWEHRMSDLEEMHL